MCQKKKNKKRKKITGNHDVNSNFHSEANFGRHGICMRGWRCQNDKMQHISLEIWPDDSWKYITQSVTGGRQFGQGLPGGSESSTKTELSWYKDALLVKDKEAITGGPHSPDKEPVTFTKMETKNQWIEMLIVGGDTGNVLKIMISLQSNVDAIINAPAEQDCINTLVTHVTAAGLCTLSTSWEGKKMLRNCNVLRLTQMWLCIHDLSGKLRGMDVHQEADTWPLKEFLWRLACISTCGWWVAACGEIQRWFAF